MTDPCLLVDCNDGVMTLRLNRPAKLNAIDDTLHGALVDADLRDDVRVLVLRGEGRAFCAGRDVSAPPTAADLESTQAVARAIVGLRQPVVAAVHGWCVGAGLEWALCADIVVAAESARFKLPEAALGVFVTGGLCATLPAIAGMARAKALMLLGEVFPAADALAWGLVASVVADDGFDAETGRVARRLAALAPAVAGTFKQVLNRIGLDRFDAAIEAENAVQHAWMAAPAK